MKTNLFKKYRKQLLLLLFLSLNLCINFTPEGVTVGVKQLLAQEDDWDTGYEWLDDILNADPTTGDIIDNGYGIYAYTGSEWLYLGNSYEPINNNSYIGDVMVYGVAPDNTPVDLTLSNLWVPDEEDDNIWYYWDYAGGVWELANDTPPPTPTYSPMGDPIDPITGYPDVTSRFNNDIENAFMQFCGAYYDFGTAVNSYGSLLEGIFSYPQDFLDYLNYFVDQVETGGPWDLKYEGNGYSFNDLGESYYAVYNGQVYNNDDFGNITFGIAAAAYGFPEEFAQAGAGFYQVLSGTSSWSFISSYFDDPRDSEMISLGYSIFYNNGGCSGY